MLVIAKGDYLSKSKYHSEKTGKDYFKMIINGEGGQMEIETDSEVNFQLYQKLEITIDILQGKYTKFKAIKIKA